MIYTIDTDLINSFEHANESITTLSGQTKELRILLWKPITGWPGSDILGIYGEDARLSNS